MPELPEVETVKESLKKRAVGHTITRVEITMEKIVKHCCNEFCQLVVGKKITDVRRKGKYLLLDLSGSLTIVGHLRMTGRMTVNEAKTSRDKYTHVVFSLDNDTELRFSDMRQFGTLYLVKNEQYDHIKGLISLGPEPLSAEFSASVFKESLKRRKVKIKQALLNQEIVAGIGNIYADEILYDAKVNPNRRVDTLSDSELSQICESIKKIIALGIKHRGTSIKDYVDGFGEPGEFQNYLQVYGQTGEKCKDCGFSIMREKIGGRSSHFCPKCQP